MIPVLGLGVALVCAGCCSSHPRSELTVQEAMRQVAEGLNAFSAAKLDQRSGLMPEEVTVVLNLTEARSRSGGAQAGVADGPAKLLVDFSQQRTETRGNQITFKFQNVLLAEKNAIVGSKSPDEIASLLQGITNQNFVLKGVQAPGK
jgi:hypothetical protein